VDFLRIAPAGVKARLRRVRSWEGVRPKAPRRMKLKNELQATEPSRQDKRRFRRTQVVRPCKIYHWPTGRYWPGTTRDVGVGGALITIDCPRPLRPGDTIEIAIAWSDRALLSASDQVEARITRVLPGEGNSQVIAVEFHQATARLEAA
jgi:hypothetical protein